MKKMLNMFGRGYGDNREDTTFSFKEPTLGPVHRAPSSTSHASRRVSPKTSAATPVPASAPEAEILANDAPRDFAEINAYFQNIVSRRKSPYNALVQSAKRLEEFIPDEISRLKAARALCIEQWPADGLSLALNTHIADIDLARDRIKSSKGTSVNERTVRLQQQAADMRQCREKIQEESDQLQRELERKQAQLVSQDEKIAALQEQLSLTQADAAGVSLIDHAAENLKDDLQAKRILLGLS